MTETLSFSLFPNPTPLADSKREELLKNPGFGTFFTDHMVLISWSDDRGWHDAKITARKPFQLDPACAVLHYAQEIFEGLKAYRGENGYAFLFRPEQNARRLVRSALRMSMPILPEEIFLDALIKLIQLDHKWIPKGKSASLYLRPFMFASEIFLGVRPAKKYVFSVIASPTSSYFKEGDLPITLWVEKKFCRAAPGGTGEAKCGGNYAASLLAQALAQKNGCDQVIFLDSARKHWIEEIGGMNVFFVMKDKSLLTPTLGGTILHGITRSSIITLAEQAGFTMKEQDYSFDQWKSDAKSGLLTETFACGTAAVITSIGKVCYNSGEFVIGSGQSGPVAQILRRRLVDIQQGRIADLHGWVYPIKLK